MKRIKNTGLVLLCISMFTMISCVEKKKESPNEKLEEVVPEEEISELDDVLDDIITLKEAKVLCENYENRRVDDIIAFEMEQNPEAEFTPTQFIDFDFKTIKKFIKYVEREARRAKVKPDSLRIYLANYGEEGQEPNRNTVFLLPTATINGESGGFFINDNGEAQLIRSYWPKTENNDGGQEGEPRSQASMLPSMNLTLFDDKSLILNNGHAGPPPFNDF